MDMKQKLMLKKTVRAIIYFFGTVIPNITFVIIFLTFMLTIISRYILRTPVTWSYEISILAYMWTMFFGVGKALKDGEHVVFSLVYDHISPRKQLLCNILSDLLIIGLLGIAFVPSLQSLLGKRMITGVLKMPYTVVFSPFIFMFAEIIIRSTLDLIEQVKAMKNLKNEVQS